MLWPLRKWLALKLIRGRPFVANLDPDMLEWFPEDEGDPVEDIWYQPAQNVRDDGKWFAMREAD